MVPVTVWFAFQNVTELQVLAAGGAMYLVASVRATRNSGEFWRRTFRLSWELQQAHTLAQKLARTDELTGLNNRRAFSALGYQALEHSRRYNRPLTVVMFDIDRFKTINDTYGHAGGDRVLQAVAATILHRVRRDVPGRIGGDEFAVLLPETAADGVVFAGGLRATLERRGRHNGEDDSLSCSFGRGSRQDVAISTPADARR
jgi:diguanylate cyclase (GGDEF)-like protein